MSCHTERIFMSFTKFSILAHRGCSSLAPENTEASIRAASKAGATGVELDVALLGDGTPVVFHDEKVNRCTNNVGALTDFSLETIKKLDCGSWFSVEFRGQKVLTLDEALLLVADLKLDLNLEIKPYKGGERRLINEIYRALTHHTYFSSERLLISSFDYLSLEIAQEVFPEANIAILYEEELPECWLEQAMRLQANAINMNVDYVSESAISQVRQVGLQVYVWTVNDINRAQQLIDMGIDGVITDRPQDLQGLC